MDDWETFSLQNLQKNKFKTGPCSTRPPSVASNESSSQSHSTSLPPVARMTSSSTGLLPVATCLLLLLGLCSTVRAHVFRTGICPNLDVVENFDYEQFLGKWYAIEKSQTTSSCLKYVFTQTNGSKQVHEKYRPFGIKIFDWNDLVQTGPLTVPDSKVPAKMTVQFPFSMNPFVASSLWVVSTDYESYASVWSCRPFIFGHFQSAMILSRNRTLDRNVINKLRLKFDYYGVDKNDFSVIDQQDCNEVDFQPQVSQEDIKKLFSGIGGGFGSSNGNQTLNQKTDNQTVNQQAGNQTDQSTPATLFNVTAATENMSLNDILP